MRARSLRIAVTLMVIGVVHALSAHPPHGPGLRRPGRRSSTSKSPSPGQRLPGRTALPLAADPREVLLLLAWDDLERARLFVDSDDLREALIRAGVAEQPDIWFLEDVRPSDLRAWMIERRRLTTEIDNRMEDGPHGSVIVVGCSSASPLLPPRRAPGRRRRSCRLHAGRRRAPHDPGPVRHPGGVAGTDQR